MSNHLEKVENILNTLKNKISDLEQNVEKLKNIISEKEIEEKKNKEKINDLEKRILYLENLHNISIEEEIDNLKDVYKNSKMIDFINELELRKLKPIYYEPNEIMEANKNIIIFLKENLFKLFVKEDLNKTAGEFLYSVGGISRKSLFLANKIYSAFFNEYKNYLKKNHQEISLNHEKDRRNLSTWIKNCLKGEEFYKYYSFINSNEIKKYLYEKNKNANTILIKLFQELICLYSKCFLSFPLVEINFIDNEINYEPSKMIDVIIKHGKNRKVNFCYLPGLFSNGRLIENGEYYVFTYINKTFKKDSNVFMDENIYQNPLLYSIEVFENIKLNIVDFILNEKEKKYEFKIKIASFVFSEYKPYYILCEDKNQKEITENEDGNFEIDKCYSGKLIFTIVDGKEYKCFDITNEFKKIKNTIKKH